jgi:hypothetical protein
MRIRFLVVDTDDHEPRDRILPVILDVPEDIEKPNDQLAKNLIIKAINQNHPHREWRWNRKIALSEEDASRSIPLQKMFESVNWDAIESFWLTSPENAREAQEYVGLVGPSQSVEPILATDTFTAYKYAMDVLKTRFPEGELAISKDAVKSINYANMAGCRMIFAEDLISKHEGLSLEYGKVMKKHDLWNLWSEDDVSKSPVWMYLYAKDHIKGRLPDTLHNKMHLMSFENSENKWVKKYLKAKKYMNRK